jgi:hypothetical protein
MEAKAMMGGMTEQEWVVAVTQIQQLKARRVRALDGKDWDAYENLHWPDHVSTNDGEPRFPIKDQVNRLRGLLHAGVVTVHHAHTPDIQFKSPNEASGVWAMEDMLYWKQGGQDAWLHGFGFYHETYAKRDGQWKFTSRSLKRLKVLTSPGAETTRADPPAV